jgi:hypothetical protein
MYPNQQPYAPPIQMNPSPWPYPNMSTLYPATSPKLLGAPGPENNRSRWLRHLAQGGTFEERDEAASSLNKMGDSEGLVMLARLRV